ncbi:F-box/FBD/LRR-repeat protein At5g53840 [Linum grandiflorum]
MEGGGGIIHPAAPDEPKDRISNLPDEIIHEIFAGLRSTKQPAQLTILSKRWSHLWRSYPVLDFDDRELPIRKENLEKFLTAAVKKFSHLQHVAAVRITLSDLQHVAAVRITLNQQRDRDLLDKRLGFVSTVTQELCLYSGPYSGCNEVPQGLFNNHRFVSLKVVKLQDCSFPSGSSVRFGSFLQVFSLKYVGFPRENDEGDAILNSIIEDASHLETLTLSIISGIRSLQIQDHPNLKTLKASKFRYSGDFEISGVESLEILHVCYRSEERFRVSLSPNNNVKVLLITGTDAMKSNEEVNKLISKFPRLESLKLIGLPSGTEVVKINGNNHKLLRSIWVEGHMNYERWPKVIEIDAPWLTDFIFDTLLPKLPTILVNKDSSKQVSVLCRLCNDIDWHDLKQLLAKSSQFRLTLQFPYFRHCSVSATDHDEQGSNVPVIEHVKLSPSILHLRDPDAYIINLLRYCRPKFISFTKSRHEQVPEKYILRLENLCKQSNMMDVTVCMNKLRI